MLPSGIYLDTGARSGFFNMQLDEWLAKRWAPDNIIPCFRLYGWKPKTVSLGYHQDFDEIDKEMLATDGIDLVVRPTGGRAILHSQELTYSVVMRSGGKSVEEFYRMISEALVHGLRIAGYNVYFANSKVNFRSAYKTKESKACFAFSGQFEIQMNGKKLVGSAQRRYRTDYGDTIVLQHGSILTGPDHRKIVNYLRYDKDKLQQLDKVLKGKTIDLNESSEILFDEESVKQSLLESVGDRIFNLDQSDAVTRKVINDFENEVYPAVDTG